MWTFAKDIFCWIKPGKNQLDLTGLDLSCQPNQNNDIPCGGYFVFPIRLKKCFLTITVFVFKDKKVQLKLVYNVLLLLD